jgi:hypothetical protein
MKTMQKYLKISNEDKSFLKGFLPFIIIMQSCIHKFAPQDGMYRVRFPMGSLNFSSDIILPYALRSLGYTQTLTEMSTKEFLWG